MKKIRIMSLFFALVLGVQTSLWATGKDDKKNEEKIEEVKKNNEEFSSKSIQENLTKEFIFSYMHGDPENYLSDIKSIYNFMLISKTHFKAVQDVVKKLDLTKFASKLSNPVSEKSKQTVMENILERFPNLTDIKIEEGDIKKIVQLLKIVPEIKNVEIGNEENKIAWRDDKDSDGNNCKKITIVLKSFYKKSHKNNINEINNIKTSILNVCDKSEYPLYFVLENIGMNAESEYKGEYITIDNNFVDILKNVKKDIVGINHRGSTSTPLKLLGAIKERKNLEKLKDLSFYTLELNDESIIKLVNLWNEIFGKEHKFKNLGITSFLMKNILHLEDLDSLNIVILPDGVEQEENEINEILENNKKLKSLSIFSSVENMKKIIDKIKKLEQIKKLNLIVYPDPDDNDIIDLGLFKNLSNQLNDFGVTTNAITNLDECQNFENLETLRVTCSDFNDLIDIVDGLYIGNNILKGIDKLKKLKNLIVYLDEYGLQFLGNKKIFNDEDTIKEFKKKGINVEIRHVLSDF
jgi:hypothetical protein